MKTIHRRTRRRSTVAVLSALLCSAGASVVPASALAAGAVRPGFDCAKASGAVLQTICHDPTLAALDRENARLLGLARKTPGLTKRRASQLEATQRGWTERRNDCWKADDARTCIRDAYMARIAELRGGYAGARAAQRAPAVSIGPVAVRCPVTGNLAATFVNVEPPLMLLTGSGRALVLTIAPSGSGARYTAAGPGGDASFWQKGPQAQVQWPGAKEESCSVAMN